MLSCCVALFGFMGLLASSTTCDLPYIMAVEFGMLMVLSLRMVSQWELLQIFSNTRLRAVKTYTARLVGGAILFCSVRSAVDPCLRRVIFDLICTQIQGAFFNYFLATAGYTRNSVAMPKDGLTFTDYACVATIPAFALTAYYFCLFSFILVSLPLTICHFRLVLVRQHINPAPSTLTLLR